MTSPPPQQQQYQYQHTPPACKYGMNCYRKSPQHHLDFSHPEALLTLKRSHSDQNTRYSAPHLFAFHSH